MSTDIGKLTVAIDFGSTYTKVAAFDLEREELVGKSQANTTIDSGIDIGLKKALEQLEISFRNRNKKVHIEKIISCSSAAGGLRMVTIGLTKTLTTKAAKEAVLGAGAKLIAAYSYSLDKKDIRCIEEQAPDLVLLTGGTDGGDEKYIIRNSMLLAQSDLSVPIVIAGNKSAADEIFSILKNAGKYSVIVENILPELDSLYIEPARKIIREIFIDRIIHAKGLDKAREIVGDVIIPTPMAVLKAAELLGRGTGDEEGWGDLLLIDVGGATTDVYSIGSGHPSQVDTILKGLAEPYAKRTVEGDLGIRYNVRSILEKTGSTEIWKQLSCFTKRHSMQETHIQSYIEYVSKTIEHIAENEEEFFIDSALAAKAVRIAMQRHAGKIEDVYFPGGRIKAQYGKDLTRFNSIIGTGGILAFNPKAEMILESACFVSSRPELLCPISPKFFVDKSYILYATGLLSEISPAKALRIIKKELKKNITS